jgi:hypothetical protein
MRSFGLLFVLCSAVCADTLVLRNGTRIDGRWWATDAEAVHFLASGHLERYARPDVSEVIFGDAPAAPVAPAREPAPAAVVPRAATEPTAAAAVRPAAPVTAFPDQIGIVYFQAPNGNLFALEQIVAAGHRVPSFYGRSTGQYWEVPGPHSSFRLRPDSALQFMVELPGRIPPGNLKLYPLESKGGTRRTKVAAVTPAEIPVMARRVSGNVYILSVVGNLAPGEYAFSPATSNNSYCFGIDAPAR